MPDKTPPTPWKVMLRSTFEKFSRDQATDLAASLTYYAIMSIFPATLAMVSLLGVFGQGESTVTMMLDLVKQLGFSDVAGQLRGPIEGIVNSRAAGIGLAVGLLAALWSASGYVGGFGRAMNRIYQVREGRGLVRQRATQLATTLFLVVSAALVLIGLGVSGPIARAVGNVIGLGETAVSAWGIAKWPVILLIVVAMVAVLYAATPNAKVRWRWLTPGAAVAILVWILASVAFGFYVSNFGSYNKTYGSLAGIIIFLLWLWITNVALLFGAELDAERLRLAELRSGVHAEERIRVPMRESKGVIKQEEGRRKLVDDRRQLREHYAEQEAGGPEAEASEADAAEVAAGEPAPEDRIS